MAFYPQNLKSFVNRLDGYSAQTVKLVPLAGRLDAGPRSQITVELPPAALIMPDSFTMYGKLTTTGTGYTVAASSPTGAAPTNPTVLPPVNVESLINSVQVTINSLVVDNGPGQLYGQLFNCIADVTLGGKKPERTFCQLGKDIPSGAMYPGQPQTDPNAAIVANTSPNPVVPIFPGSTAALGGTYDGSVARSARQIAISNWLGFLNGGEVLDTDAVGSTRITITLADTNALVVNELTTASASYAITNLFFTVTVVSLSPEWYATSSRYYDMGNFTERKMNLWWAYQGSVIAGTYAGQLGQPVGTNMPGGIATQTVNFSLASQSIDLLIGTYITVADSNRPFMCRYETNQNMIPSSDYKSSVGKGAAFKRPGNFVQDYQFSINSFTLPTFRVSRDEAFMHLLTQLGLAQDTIEGTNAAIDTLDKWNESHWMCAFSLSALAPTDSRLISGFPSRGTNTNFSFDVTGNPQAPMFNVRPTVFVRTSSVLRIGKNRMIEVVT